MICICTATYALGKELGLVDGVAEFQRQLREPDLESLPCVRVITRLRSYDEIAIHHDIAATSIAKSRSRAFHAARQLDPDVLVWVDDDVEADSFTLGMMLDAVRGQNVICLAPCFQRGTHKVTVELAPDAEWRELPSRGRTHKAVSGAFGLVAMSREAMTSMIAHYEGDGDGGIWFRDDDGERKLGLFHETIERGVWAGEDIAFCRRALVAGVNLEALTTGTTVHDNRSLDLSLVVGSLPR